MVRPYDPDAPGFTGDDNLYGIGIRVGFYTQAVSIWIANFYARHEAPYLHSLATLFLLALLVGICVMCRDPAATYAVEPFMLVSIAYHTLFLGLWDPAPPYALPWELDSRKPATVKLIWLAFEGFDAWYWWIGVWKMKPSNGPQGTIIFFPYVGNTPLFGEDAWIHIAAKVLNVFVTSILSVSLARLCWYTFQQRRLDRDLSLDQISQLTARWSMQQSMSRIMETEKPIDTPSEMALTQDSPGTCKEKHPLAHASASEELNRCSNKSAHEIDSHCKSAHNRQEELAHIGGLKRPIRTGTGLLKLGLLRWTPRKEIVNSEARLDCPDHEPEFERVSAAERLLRHSSDGSNRKFHLRGWWAWLKIWLCAPIWIYEAIAYVAVQVRHPFRPSILFAIMSHSYNLKFGKRLSYSKTLRLALQHPHYLTVTSRDVTLASRLILATEPAHRMPRGVLMGLGWLTLGACSILIIGTELTIIWNKIQGVQELATVGQLIPFTLGVSGLLKVIWSALFEREQDHPERRYYYGKDPYVQHKKAQWKEAGLNFELAQRRMEKFRDVVSAQEQVTDSCDMKV